MSTKTRPSLLLLLLLLFAVPAPGCINSYTSSGHPGDYDLDIELPEYDEEAPDSDAVSGENSSDGDRSDTDRAEDSEDSDIEGEIEGDVEGGELDGELEDEAETTDGAEVK